jgi:hypothetical protein
MNALDELGIVSEEELDRVMAELEETMQET